MSGQEEQDAGNRLQSDLGDHESIELFTAGSSLDIVALKVRYGNDLTFQI